MEAGTGEQTILEAVKVFYVAIMLGIKLVKTHELYKTKRES